MVDEKLLRLAKIELAKRNFFAFCNLVDPVFYSESRQYIVKLCNEFQDFYENDDQVMIINMPPRHGKSRTASLFVLWLLGKSIKNKIMTGSYNETLSTTFSKSVRNAISEQKADDDVIVYNDIFPNTHVQRGDASSNLWRLEGSQVANYLATSPGGTATGFGCNFLILDDIIKNKEEAYNENVKLGHWDWFCNTLLSRLEKGKIICIATRWATDDLSGKILEWCETKHKRYKHINMKALQDDGTMLCDEVLDRETFEDISTAMGEDIVSANYQQVPIDIKGCLYTHLQTYEDIPRDYYGDPLFESIDSYCDTADKGEDYLSHIVYGVYRQQAYILDIVFTQEPMEITEQMVAESLYKNKVNNAVIESNNGGRGFGRNIERILKFKYRSNRTNIIPFTQRKNKEARILSNATWIMNNVYFPVNWRDRWNEAYKDLIKYQRTGKNLHDDLEDALTGVAERILLDSGERYSDEIYDKGKKLVNFDAYYKYNKRNGGPIF